VADKLVNRSGRLYRQRPYGRVNCEGKGAGTASGIRQRRRKLERVSPSRRTHAQLHLPLQDACTDYVYGRETKADAAIAEVMTLDKARLIAANIAKLPVLLKQPSIGVVDCKSYACGAVTKSGESPAIPLGASISVAGSSPVRRTRSE
jgi:hypothetical protein